MAPLWYEPFPFEVDITTPPWPWWPYVEYSPYILVVLRLRKSINMNCPSVIVLVK